MHITKRKKQAIKNIVAALLSLLLLFSALRLIPALLRALPDSGADYLTGVLNGALGLDGRRYAYLPVQTPGITTPSGRKAAQRRRTTPSKRTRAKS